MLFAAWMLMGLFRLRGEPPVRILENWVIRVGEEGMAEDVAFGPDGRIYVAGRGRDIQAAEVGEPDPESAYPGGFVTCFSPDGSERLGTIGFASGGMFATSVAVNETGVYVGGYGTAALRELMPADALFPRADPKAKGRPLFTAPEHRDEPGYAETLKQRGAPVVLRLDHDLTRVTAGTYLEGWQSAWHVPRPLNEDRWQPVGLVLLDDGSVVVSHDGGYNLPVDEGELPGYREFYHAPDYLSRLSPDLKSRMWRREVYTPEVAPGRVMEMFRNWDYADRGFRRPPAPDDRSGGHFDRAPHPESWDVPTFGQTRILRLRSDGRSRIYAAGWSPTRTFGEPWWSPFLFAYDLEGNRVWKAYNPDPMSGDDGRMEGLVSDSAVRSVNVAADGGVLASLIGDGGNSVLRRDPLDYRRETDRMKGDMFGFGGRMLFWGAVVRLRPGTGELDWGRLVRGMERARVKPAWVTDLAGLPDGSVVAVGRAGAGFEFTADAWTTGPGGFLRMYDPEGRLVFSTGLENLEPWTVAVRGDRIAVVGRWSRTPISLTGKPSKPVLYARVMILHVQASENEMPRNSQDSQNP